MKNKIVSEACEALADALGENNNDNKSCSKKSKEKRARRFSCVTYIPTDALDKWLRSLPWVQHWAYCHHDSDVWSEEDERADPSHKAGTPKKAHTHVILYTFEAKTSSSIKKHFDKLAFSCDNDNPQNTKVQFCHDGGAQFRYLCHEDDPIKHQYAKACRVADDYHYWEHLSFTDGLNDVNSNYGLSMVQDVLDGVSNRLMCERYGKEWIYHSRYIRDMAFSIEREEKQGHIDFDKTMVELILKDSPFYEVDKAKFFEIFDYIGKTISNDFGEKPIINFYLGGDKQ